MKKPTLAAVLIVKNEADNLRKCLASLDGLVDEIVILDSGSQDETPAIAAQLAGMGVDYGQGYAHHRPEPLAVIASPATSHPETNAAQKTTDGTQPAPGETR